MEKTLVLPSSYQVIDDEEMEYIDGGWYLNVCTVKVGGAILNTAIGLAIGGGVGGVAAYIRKKGRKEAQKVFSKTIKSKLKAIGLGALAGSIGTAVNFALNYADIGTNVCKWLDKHDAKKNNGWLTIGW